MTVAIIRERRRIFGHTETQGKGRVKTEAEFGEMQPQAEERVEPPEPGTAGRILPCGLWRGWTWWHLDFVYPLGLWKNTLLLSEPTKIVVICYSSPRKLIEMSNVGIFLSSLLPPYKHGDLLNNHLPWRMRHRVQLRPLQLWKKSLLLSQLWRMGADLLNLLSERALVWFQPQWNKWEFQSCSGTQTNTWMTFLQNFHWLRKRHFFRILFIVLHFEWLEYLQLCEQQNALDRQSGAEGGTDCWSYWGHTCQLRLSLSRLNLNRCSAELINVKKS